MLNNLKRPKFCKIDHQKKKSMMMARFRYRAFWVTSMLVIDVGDEICWWQLYDVSDGFDHFGHQHPLSSYISVGHQYSKDVTNIDVQRLVTEFKYPMWRCHQHHYHRFLSWLQSGWWLRDVPDLGCRQHHRHQYHDVNNIIFVLSFFDCNFESE